jgi:predicted nucleotidyltransferase/uncharacterized protein YutE (UPF0331/DUF86 family)
MTDLGLLAPSLQVSDRTLRRAAARGTIRTQRRGERRQLPLDETLYLERRWPLIRALVDALRTLPAVRLAVLYGSVARGEEHEWSDIDLLVRLAGSRLRSHAQLLAHLEAATDRPVQVVAIEDANSLLLADVLRDGRVLVDRDGEWTSLVARAPQIRDDARAAREQLERELFEGLGEVLAGGMIPVPIASRLRAIVPSYRVLQVVLAEVTFEDYKAGLHSTDPVTLKDVVFPLERACEVASNLVVELVGYGLDDLGIARIDGPRDLTAFAREGAISKRLAEQLTEIHRSRNAHQHDYPDLRASVIYPACQELTRVLPAFLRAYTQWLGERGYAVPTF